MEKLKQAVILAGGRGERLKPITDTTPKPMIILNGKPFLEYQIEMLKENGISEVLILSGYLAEKIEEYFGDGSKFGIKMKYSVLPLFDPDGLENESGTRIKNAAPLLDDFFLLMYCDNYWPLNLKKIFGFYHSKGKIASVVVYDNKDNFTKNNVLVDSEGLVTKYDKSRTEQNLNGVEIGFFLINKKVLEMFPDKKFQFEKEILPKLIDTGQLAAYVTGHRYCSISKPERLESTEKYFLPKKVIFLDRDGVINKKPPKADYVKKWEEFEFLPGAREGLKKLSDNGFQIYLVSNQPGIARGMMTEEDLAFIHQKMQEELKKDGIKIEKIYYCPHGWDQGCECRKPKPGLLFQAARENNLDLTKTIFIGDDERDIQAGEAADIKMFLVGPQKSFLQTVNDIIKIKGH
jgi:histidinol-phosphate phosphatase family protein